jgi:hypothetical protein
MKISCSNCGVAHETDDYPNAFEINCVCGYSILVPVGAPMPPEKTITTFDKAFPSAMDAEDDAILIRPEGLLSLDSSGEENAKTQGVLQMTPAEQLPPGMVYDSFELPSSEDLDADSEPPPLQEPSDDSFEKMANVTSKGSPEPTPKSSLNIQPSEAQKMVQRVQMASMGQFLGPDYRLTLAEVSPQQSDSMMTVIGRMLRERAWLESECKKRGIDFKKEIEQGVVSNVPELIALEIYLTSFKLGVNCKFEIMA